MLQDLPVVILQLDVVAGLQDLPIPQPRDLGRGFPLGHTCEDGSSPHRSGNGLGMLHKLCWGWEEERERGWEKLWSSHFILVQKNILLISLVCLGMSDVAKPQHRQQTLVWMGCLWTVQSCLLVAHPGSHGFTASAWRTDQKWWKLRWVLQGSGKQDQGLSPYTFHGLPWKAAPVLQLGRCAVSSVAELKQHPGCVQRTWVALANCLKWKKIYGYHTAGCSLPSKYQICCHFFLSIKY